MSTKPRNWAAMALSNKIFHSKSIPNKKRKEKNGVAKHKHQSN